MSTPNYVKAAVLAYLENGTGAPLTQLFENGIPLHTFPETRDIIIKLINGEAPRKAGKPKLTEDDKAKRYSALLLVAQLHGAGLGLFSGGGNKTKKTACDVVGRIYGMKSGTVYKEIWLPSRDLDAVQMHIEIGRNNKQCLTLFSID